jgi:hypothetical protein
MKIDMMNGLDNSIYVQEREYSSPALKELMQEEFGKYNNTINRLFILDNNDVMTVGLAKEREPLVGSDLSFRDWVRERVILLFSLMVLNDKVFTGSLSHIWFSTGFRGII